MQFREFRMAGIELEMGFNLVAYIFEISKVGTVLFSSISEEPLSFRMCSDRVHNADTVHKPCQARLPENVFGEALECFMAGNLHCQLLSAGRRDGVGEKGQAGSCFITDLAGLHKFLSPFVFNR